MDFHGESTNRTAYWWEQQSYTFYKAMKLVPSFPLQTTFPEKRPSLSCLYLHFQRPDHEWTTAQSHQQHNAERTAKQHFLARMPSPVLVHSSLSLLPALPRHEEKKNVFKQLRDSLQKIKRKLRGRKLPL